MLYTGWFCGDLNIVLRDFGARLFKMRDNCITFFLKDETFYFLKK